MHLSPDLDFDADKQQLHLNDGEAPIELTFAEAKILTLLCQHEGQVVSKQMLTSSAWPDRVVSDSSLQNALSTLRRKLAPFSDIELKTVPRRGYALHLPKLEQTPWWNVQRVSVVAVFIALLTLVGFQVLGDKTPRQHYLEQQLGSELNVAKGKMQVLRQQQQPFDEMTLAARINNQFVHESDWQVSFKDYQGMALLTEQGDSFVFCPNYQDGQCSGDKLISIFGEPNQGGQQKLSDFLATKIRMEEKTYNRLQFDELGGNTEGMVEQLYFGDAYFKLSEQHLARADMRISAVPLEDNNGLFFFAACVTDEDCFTTPLKYRVNGRYVETQELWGERQVSRFTVSLTSVELSSPNRLSKMAKQLYREFRKSELSLAELVFFRLYQDDQTAIWMIPFANNSMVWTQKRTLHL